MEASFVFLETGSHHIVQGDLRLSDLTASASQVLRIKVYTTIFRPPIFI